MATMGVCRARTGVRVRGGVPKGFFKAGRPSAPRRRTAQTGGVGAIQREWRPQDSCTLPTVPPLLAVLRGRVLRRAA